MYNPLLLEIAFLVGRLSADNDWFYNMIVEWDIDDTIEWYEGFYTFIYGYFSTHWAKSKSSLDVIHDDLDQNKLNSLLYLYITS